MSEFRQRYGDCPVCGKGIKYLGAPTCSPKCDLLRLKKAREGAQEDTQEGSQEDEDHFPWLVE